MASPPYLSLKNLYSENVRKTSEKQMRQMAEIMREGGNEMKNNKKMIVGFLAPAVIIFLIVFLYPIIRTIMMSFFKIDSVTDTMDLWTFVGIQNYEKLFGTAIFRKSMLNLFKIWALGGAIVLSVSLLFGVILTSGIRGKKFFRAVIYLPNLVSAVALATMWLQYVYSSKFGLLNLFLMQLVCISWQTHRGWTQIINSGHCFLHIALE